MNQPSYLVAVVAWPTSQRPEGNGMKVWYFALVVGALGLLYGLMSPKLTKKQATIGAFALLAAGLALIVLPLAMGMPWS